MEIRAGFEPAINSFADCPLEPLEYRITCEIEISSLPSGDLPMTAHVGNELSAALPLVIRTGFEPVLQP